MKSIKDNAYFEIMFKHLVVDQCVLLQDTNLSDTKLIFCWKKAYSIQSPLSKNKVYNF